MDIVEFFDFFAVHHKGLVPYFANIVGIYAIRTNFREQTTGNGSKKI